MPTITQFVNKILDDVNFEPKEIEVVIDTRFYPSQFGINVRPLEVFVKTETNSQGSTKQNIVKSYNILELNELFKVKKVYLLVKETKYRRLLRCPQSILIDPTIKEYEGNKYYNYRIFYLCTMDLVQSYEEIRKNAYALLKKAYGHFGDTSEEGFHESRDEEELPPEMLG